MRRTALWMGTLGMLLVSVAGVPLGAAPSVAEPTNAHARAASLPPEFSGTLTLTFDVTASESYSDMTSGHYDVGRVFGSVTLRPREGSVSQLFDPFLGSNTSALAATSTMKRYAPDNPCQDYEFQYEPASGYPGFPAYFTVKTPELSLMEGYRWGIYLLPIVGAQSNGCPGQDGNWPIVMFDDLVSQFIEGAVPNVDKNGGRLHLSGTKTANLSSPAVVRHNKHACAPDGVYFEPCVTSLHIRMDYDLQRISPDRPASQYPKLVLRNDRRGDDTIRVRTDTAVRNTRVTVFRVTRGSGVMRSVNTSTTNRQGVVRFTLRDSQPDQRRWFIASVAGTSNVLAGISPTQSIR